MTTGDERKSLVFGCRKCSRMDLKVNKCKAYPNPAYWWRKGSYCPLYPLWKAEKVERAAKAKEATAKIRADTVETKFKSFNQWEPSKEEDVHDVCDN